MRTFSCTSCAFHTHIRPSLFVHSPLHLLTFLFDLTRIRCAIPDGRCNAKLQSNNNGGASFASFDSFSFRTQVDVWKHGGRSASRKQREIVPFIVDCWIEAIGLRSYEKFDRNGKEPNRVFVNPFLYIQKFHVFQKVHMSENGQRGKKCIVFHIISEIKMYNKSIVLRVVKFHSGVYLSIETVWTEVHLKYI